MDETYPARLAEQLVIEVKAAMARAGVRSSRALARLIGESSQYVSMRLDGGNPRTGERVPLNVRDLIAIAEALNVLPSALIARAEAAVSEADDTITLMAASETEDDTEVESWQEHP